MFRGNSSADPYWIQLVYSLSVQSKDALLLRWAALAFPTAAAAAKWEENASYSQVIIVYYYAKWQHIKNTIHKIRHAYTRTHIHVTPNQWLKWKCVAGGAQDEAPKAPRTRRRRRRGGGEWGGGIPLPSRLGGLGERRELPQRGPGRSPGRQRIWCILFVIEPIWWKENSVCLLTTILTQINIQL